MNSQPYSNKPANSNGSYTTTVLSSSQLLSYMARVWRYFGHCLKHHVYLWTFFVVMAEVVWPTNNAVSLALLSTIQSRPTPFVYRLRHDASMLPSQHLRNIGTFCVAEVQEHISWPPENNTGCCCNSLLHSLKTLFFVHYSTTSSALHEK
jgi:hypothetical protein